MQKDYKELRIIFLGTPDFAVASLDTLIQAGCNIVAVVTAPDKPAGRGMQLTQTPIKKYAIEKGLKILQPEKLKNIDFLEELKALQADIQVVVAFRMLPELVWNMPPMGTINLHASLLPHFRGAAPINWAIITGEKETGLTTFKLQQEIDTGNILLQEKIQIGEDETAGELHDRMKTIGAELVLKTVKGLADGILNEIPQHPEGGFTEPDGTVIKIKQAPKIHSETCLINWSNPVEQVYNLIRGLSPYPAAFFIINEKIMKVYKAKKEVCFPKGTEGDYETDGKTFLKFACTNGYVHLLEVQLEGKKRMKIEEFLRGYKF
jgi:methionyl-tRNA formyltransferase